MSGIVLSSSVRQNLLSLQSTADLLATTQNRLATGKKVNTALDNPTNFFTAQSLDSRAGDINNLLDGIGNGVQVLQAANTGITSLQKLVDTAKSIANQALQTASATPPSRTCPRRSPAPPQTTCAAPRATPARPRPPTCCSPARPAAPPLPLSGTTLGGTSASLVGTAAADGAGTAAALPWPDPGRCGQRHDIAANGAAVRRRDPDRQRQDHHLQVGLGPGGSGCSRRIRRQRQYRHRRQRQLHRLYRHDRHADGHGAGSGERHRPRQRRPEDRQHRRRGDALQLLGHQRRHRGRCSHPDTGTGADLSITGRADL